MRITIPLIVRGRANGGLFFNHNSSAVPFNDAEVDFCRRLDAQGNIIHINEAGKKIRASAAEPGLTAAVEWHGLDGMRRRHIIGHCGARRCAGSVTAQPYPAIRRSC